MHFIVPTLLCILRAAGTCSSCMDFRSKNTTDALRKLVHHSLGNEEYDTIVPQDGLRRSANSRKEDKTKTGNPIPKARIAGRESGARVVVLRRALVMESVNGFKIIAHHIPVMAGKINEHGAANEACFITARDQNLDLSLVIDYPAASGKTRQFLYRDRIGNISYKSGGSNKKYKAQIYAGKDYPLLKILIQKPTVVFLK